MNPILFAIPVFLITILLEAFFAWRKNRMVYDIPDAVTSLHHGVLSQLTGLMFKIVFIGLYVTVYERYRAAALSETSLWVWLFAMLFYDFCYYWAHRFEHEVGVLWAAHIVHHSSEYYNLSTALRQPSTTWLFTWIFFLPLAVAGVPPEVFIGVGLIDLLYQYWVHTELVGKLGWFDRIFSSPSNHRVHHGKNDYCIDKNYGGVFIFWDRMFGTFEEERDDETIMYGIRNPLHSYNPLWGVMHYYHELWQAMQQASGWRAKLGIWIAPPGLWNDAGLAHLETTGMQRFVWHTPAAVRWYVAVQYLLTVPLIMHCIGIGEQLDAMQLTLYLVVLVGTMQVLGALLNMQRNAYLLELVRTVALGLAFFLSPNWFGYGAPVAVKIATLGTMLGSALWIVMIQRNQTGTAGTAA